MELFKSKRFWINLIALVGTINDYIPVNEETIIIVTVLNFLTKLIDSGVFDTISEESEDASDSQ